ncbi:MAG: hypothetical protein LBN43_05005 [Oscillospiraceae bacterium]|jgi:uncharacterized repeat protein (TIGR01451 family)|nr:hypothetical protein [Oscillospiraceae bacterium]
MKKISAIVLAIVMFAVLGVTAFAAKSPSVSASLKANKAEIVLGEELTYSVTLTNKSGYALNDVTVLKFNDNSVIQSVAMASGAKEVVTFNATPQNVGEFAFKIRVYANYTTANPVLIGDAEVKVKVLSNVLNANLSVKSDKTAITLGDKVKFTATLTNTSDRKLTNVAFALDDGTLVGNVKSSLAINGAFTANQTVIPAVAGDYKFNVTAYANYGAANQTSLGTAEVTVTVAGKVYTADISITPESADIFLGDSIKITLSIKNTSAYAIPDVAIVLSDDYGTVLQTYGSIAKGKTVKYTYTVTPEELTDFKIYAFHVYYDYNSSDDPDEFECLGTTVSVKPVIPSGTLTVTQNGTSFILGDKITYTVTLTNTSGHAIPNVAIILPGYDTTTVIASTKSLAANGKLTAKYTETTWWVTKSTLERFVAYSNYSELGGDYLTEAFSNNYEIKSPVEITVKPNVTDAKVGDEVTYTITVKNISKYALSKITLTTDEYYSDEAVIGSIASIAAKKSGVTTYTETLKYSGNYRPRFYAHLTYETDPVTLGYGEGLINVSDPPITELGYISISIKGNPALYALEKVSLDGIFVALAEDGNEIDESQIYGIIKSPGVLYIHNLVANRSYDVVIYDKSGKVIRSQAMIAGLWDDDD